MPDRKKLILIIVMLLITFFMTWLLRIDIKNQDQLAGYWTLGDVGVYLSAALLGGPWGALVAAVASAVADIVIGQAIYVPASLIIKAAMALLFAWYIKQGSTILHLAKGVGYAGLLMVFGYFLYNLIVRGSYPMAAIGLPINLLQVIASGIIAVPVLFLIGGKNYREGYGFQTDRQDNSFGRKRSSRNLK